MAIIQRSIRILLFVTVMLAAAGAKASDYAFTLHNRSEGWVINGFYTYQNGRWSKNWLKYKVKAGQSVKLDWNSNDGECVVPFRVSWDGYGSDDYKVDWCKGIRNIYMLNEGFKTD